MIRNDLDLSRIEKDELQVRRGCFPIRERVIDPVILDFEPALQRGRR